MVQSGPTRGKKFESGQTSCPPKKEAFWASWSFASRRGLSKFIRKLYVAIHVQVLGTPRWASWVPNQDFEKYGWWTIDTQCLVEHFPRSSFSASALNSRGHVSCVSKCVGTVFSLARCHVAHVTHDKCWISWRFWYPRSQNHGKRSVLWDCIFP